MSEKEPPERRKKTLQL